MSLSRTPARDTSENPSHREQIRTHMKMVIDQLQGIVTELKDVAKELREVVGQIDKLTSDFDFDLEPDDWTVATASSTDSSERGLGDAFRLDLLSADMLSDSWEFCNFLEGSSSPSAAPPPRKPAERAEEEAESRPERRRATATATAPGTATAYSQMNGGLPIPNGPLIITPDSSSEEAASSTHCHKTTRTPGTRERVRFSDKILYHALCCDDDDDEEGEEEGEGAEEGGCGTPETDDKLCPSVASSTPTPTATLKLPPSKHSHHNCLDSSPLPSYLQAGRGQTTLGNPTPAKKGLLNPGSRKKLVRNSSTQTVSDKSTQTVLPYIPAKQKTKDLH